MSWKTEKDPEAIAIARTLNNVPWCDEYEKLISGMLHDPSVMSHARLRAMQKYHEFNNKNWAAEAKSMPELDRACLGELKNIFGQIGEGSVALPPIRVDYGCNIRIGRNFFANFDLSVLDSGLVLIGDRVKLGPHVSIVTVLHDTDVAERRTGQEWARTVRIGDDCWIGTRATILPGVTIGKGCTIGAGSVVTRDVPDWSVAVGNPARVVRKVNPVGPPAVEAGAAGCGAGAGAGADAADADAGAE